MKVSSSELPPRQVSLEIEVEQERLDRAMEQAFQRIAGRVNVPGFRKGRAPRPMVERIVGKQAIVEDALEHLVPDVVNEAVAQQRVEPYARPRVEAIEFEPLRVRAVVPLPPRIELGPYATDLRIEREEAAVDQGQVDAVIARLRESQAQWVPVSRPVQAGDRVGLDVRGQVQGSERLLLDSKDAEIVADPDGPQPAEGFVDQILGLSEGEEQSFTLSLPREYREAALAGQPVAFTVRLHWVKEKELPALDDTFAQQVGDYADLAAVRGAIEAQVREREEQRIRESSESAALDKLVEISAVEVPPQLVQHQTEHLLETFAQNVERQGLKLEQYLSFVGKDMAGLRDELRGEAEKRVKRSLALDAFATAEAITVEPAEVEEEVEKAAAGLDEAETARLLALGNPETLARVEGVVRERKALQRLVSLATGQRDAPPSALAPPAKSSRPSPEPADTQSQSGEPAAVAAAGAAAVQEQA